MPIQIVSKKDGFRRCGIPHPSSPTTYADDRFTKEELEILKNEPMLIVTKVDKKEKAEIDKKLTEPNSIDYSSMKFNELRALAKEKNLKASGSKKDLIKKLRGAE